MQDKFDDRSRLFDKSYYDRAYFGGAEQWGSLFRRRRPFCTALLRRLLSYADQVQTIVEVGCGLGFMTRCLVDLPKSPRVITGDISATAMNEVRTRLATYPNLEVRRLNAEELDLESNTAQVLICMDVIEHLPKSERFFSEAFRVLSDGGVLFFSTPNTLGLGARVKDRTQSDQAPSPYEWHGSLDRTHIGLRSPAEWRRIASEQGFNLCSDGSDFWWDTPYFRYVPRQVEDVMFKAVQKALAYSIAFAPWYGGENYYAIFRKR